MIGSALKPLVRAHGWDKVRPAWQRYLRDSTHPAPNANDFRAHFGDWARRASEDVQRKEARLTPKEIAEAEADRDRYLAGRTERRSGKGGGSHYAIQVPPEGEVECNCGRQWPCLAGKGDEDGD